MNDPTPYREMPLVKSKIIATVGPACAQRDQLFELARAGVDLFRLNFAHGRHDWLAEIVSRIRSVSEEIGRPLGILGDLAGPKIRLGVLPEDGVVCEIGQKYSFVKEQDTDDPHKLTCTYDGLIDDLRLGDRVLLADGTVLMTVVEKEPEKIVCEVVRPGTIRSRQGINLPGVQINTPTLTEKDQDDVAWAVAHELDYLGLSFVRRPEDIDLLRSVIADAGSEHAPQIVAKIEKVEAIAQIDGILERTDAMMVARGDLGVEADITRVPALQKQIIRLCNQWRIPVITATQMLDSMEENETPTRAEASDVANAVLDGSDAVMLSGETAIGKFPTAAVTYMSRIAREAERLVVSSKSGDTHSRPNTRAELVTEATTLAASIAAEQMDAHMIVVATRSGRTAMAVSKQRSRVPVLALTDRPEVARRMCLYWGVTPLFTEAVQRSPDELLEFVVQWGQDQGVLESGARLVLVGNSKWSAVTKGKNLMLVHAVP